MLKIPLSAFYDKANYQLRYVDYSTNQWTVPSVLTKERAEKFLTDLSVVQVKIITDSDEFILDLI